MKARQRFNELKDKVIEDLRFTFELDRKEVTKDNFFGKYWIDPEKYIEVRGVDGDRQNLVVRDSNDVWIMKLEDIPLENLIDLLEFTLNKAKKGKRKYFGLVSMIQIKT